MPGVGANPPGCTGCCNDFPGTDPACPVHGPGRAQRSPAAPLTTELGPLAVQECPFCRSPRVRLLIGYYVGCEACFAAGPDGDTPEEAVARWNQARPGAPVVLTLTRRQED